MAFNARSAAVAKARLPPNHAIVRQIFRRVFDLRDENCIARRQQFPSIANGRHHAIKTKEKMIGTDGYLCARAALIATRAPLSPSMPAITAPAR
jgi:hypothetical protein